MTPALRAGPLLPPGGRVLVFCGDPGVPALGPSGCSAHLRGIVSALVARGYDVRVAVPRLEDRRGRVDAVVEAPVITSPPRRWGWLPRRWRDRGETWDGRRLLAAATADGWVPDLIWERSSLLCDAGARSTLPRLLEVNAPLSIERTDVRDLDYARAVERRSLAAATRVVTVSTWLRRWAIDQGCASDRVRCVPNASDLPRGDRDVARAALGLTGLVIGFVGSMKPWHGVDRIPAILDALPAATALIVGDGPVTVPHPRARSVGQLTGKRLADAIAAMDVGLAPYPADAPPWFCPLKVADYRSQGVPVVASDLGDVARTVGGGGVCLPPAADPRAWAAAIEGQAGRRTERPAWTWRDVVDEALAR